MILSLRARLLSGIITGTAVLLAILCTLIYVSMRRNVIHQFDKSLLTTARLLSAIIQDEGFQEEKAGPHDNGVNDQASEKSPNRELEFEFDVRMTPEFNDDDGGAYYQFWSQDGSLTVRSPSLGQRDLQQSEGVSTIPTYRECILPDGNRGRAVSLGFLTRGSEDEQDQQKGIALTLVVAKDASDLHGFLLFMRWLLLGSSLIILVMSTGVGLGVTRTSLHPIRVLARGIESVHKDNLGKRFSAEAYPVELLPICDCLNALLERLKSSFEREQRFNSDVAHELRTPLAGIQSIIEVSLSRQRDSTEYEASLHACLEIVRSMHKMIDTLLSLTKLDSRKISAQRQNICLKALIEDRWQNFADKGFDRNLTFENLVRHEITCVSDRDYLGMIVSNALDNAVEYSNQGGRIWVSAEKSGDAILLSISNTGCELTREEVTHVFDSFWRKNESRSDTGEHWGIGLAVVRKMTEALGIGVEAVIEHQEIFTIRFELPTTGAIPPSRECQN